MDFKKVPSKVLKDLYKGKNVHIDKCIRQPHSARDAQRIGSIGEITLSTSSTKTRTVTSNTDWLEAMLSSILPVLIALANCETTIEGVKPRLARIEQHVNYCLAGLHLYRQCKDFNGAKVYLESLRDQRWTHNGDVSEPDITDLTMTLQRSTHSSSSSSSSSSHSNSSSSSSSSHSASRSNTNRHSTHKKAAYVGEQCGKFNSFDGCHDPECSVKHMCKLCKSEAHGKTKCPKFTKKK
jgi:hypothetical protein